MSTRRTLLTAALAALVAMPLSAQTHRVAISLMSGGAIHTDMAAEAATEVRLADGWQAGFQIERWSDRLGVRLNGSFTADGLADDPNVDMNLYTADLDLMLRLRRPEFGKLFMPYIALGAGASLYNRGGTFTTLGGETYGPDPVIRPTALGALGFDIGAGRTVLRFEAFDRVDVMSPLEQGPGPNDFYGPVHHLSASLGLSFRFGGGAAMPMMLSEKAPEPVAAPAIEHVALEREPEPQPAPARTADAVRVEAMAFEIESLQARVAELERQVAEVAARPPQIIAAAAPAPVAEPVAEPVRPVYSGPLYTVQIASYLEGDADRAERVAEDMRAQGIPVWVTRAEVNGRTVRRVRVGALTSRADAQALGMHINRTYDWPFWVSLVDASEPVPPDAIAATRTYLLASRTNN